jgi:uncharacterized protein
MASEVTVVRIYLHEADRGRRGTLMREILNVLHDQHRAVGVSAFRGIAGLDEAGEIEAADMLRFVVDLPIVIEFFAEPEAAETILAALQGRVPAGHILTWPASAR